ncbi:DMP19 family protein [Pirellulaceae bacterium SH449]
MSRSENINDMAKVCNDLFVRLLESTSGRIDVAKLTTNELVVVLVWHVNGLIGNMGLAHTLEVDIPGDSFYVKTLSALSTINADGCFQALREAVDICRVSDGHKIEWELEPQKCQRLEELEGIYFGCEDVLIEKLCGFIRKTGLSRN